VTKVPAGPAVGSYVDAVTAAIRIALESARPPGDVLRLLACDRRPFALVGSWAGGGAIIGSEPVREVLGPTALDAIDMDGLEAPSGFVGGGWFGYWGFGLAASIERLPPPPARPAALPAADLAFYDHVLRLDPEGRWWFEALHEDATARRLDELRARLAAPVSRRAWRVGPLRVHGAGGAGHRAAVADCVNRIAAGELFQANLCLRLDGRATGSMADAFADAAGELQPTYGAFMGLDRTALLSFSPELFLRRRGREVETAPIKGTSARTDDDEAAAVSRAALATSVKDAAEHVMIVDLMRNDLGRVAAVGTVHADRAPAVEAHPGVWHLVSRVRARLRDEVTDSALLRATFPPGSVTGAPKIQALKVIAALEGTGREVYTGAIGFVSPAAGLELNVAIRTLEVRDGRAWLGCGGGIVADSDPARELAEALDKAAPIAAALHTTIADRRGPRRRRAPAELPGLGRRPDLAQGVLETVLVRDRRAVDLGRHLERMAASARAALDRELPSTTRAQAEAAAVLSRSGASRLRLALGADGRLEVETHPAPPARDLRLRPVVLAGGLGAHKLVDRTPWEDYERGGDAALICDLDGAALEASSANLWALIGRRLVTPPADGRILDGLVRRRLLDLGAVEGVTLVTEPLWFEQVRGADALVVTSSVRGAVAAGIGHAPTQRARALADAMRTALRHDTGAARARAGGGLR